MRQLAWTLTAVLAFGSAGIAADRPNILWLSCEDISPHLGCYGFQNAVTPTLDALATESALFEHAYTTAGVCAPCRSAIITGMYQTSTGTHHMRCTATLPDHIQPFTFWLREAGYYCTNNSKQDYQFKTPADTWDESSGKAHWKRRKSADQPFFSVFNYTGCHESAIAGRAKYESVVKGRDKLDRQESGKTLPPYYPRTENTLEDWGRYYDVVSAMDHWVDGHLKALDEAGLTEDTIVVFWSDHGVGLPRAKRWLYESGTHVPLICRVPPKWQKLAGPGFEPGTRSKQLISMIDLGPSMLSLAGIRTPEHMQGRAFIGPHAGQPRKYIFGARDRMDERYDIIRMVRDSRFRYVRNYEPWKTWYQYMNTPEKGQTMQAIRSVADMRESEQPPEVIQFLEPRKPLEELYDVSADPHEMKNLAEDPMYADKLKELREQHLSWVTETRDLGLIPEAELHRLKKKLGSEWAILNLGAGNEKRMELIRDAAVMAGGTDPEALNPLSEWLTHKDSVVRYWAAVGISNRSHLIEVFQVRLSLLIDLLSDESENVRIAASRALARIGQEKIGLKALEETLDNGTQWARLHAAIVLDEMNSSAQSAVNVMKRNKDYRDGFVAKGKYTVRVLNKALNDIEGTDNIVP